MSVEIPDRELLEQPWMPVCLGGVQFLVKYCFGDTVYHLLLSNMQSVWEERVDAAVIQDRAQELNKRLRAPVDAFFSHLCTVARPLLAGEASTELAENGVQPSISLLHLRPDRLTLRLKSELAGVPFYWEFRCMQSSVTVVCSHLVCPLLAVSRVLQKQVMELSTLLSRKDVEIQDYRESGAVLSRGRLQTVSFDLDHYQETFMTQVLPKVCAVQDCFSFDTTLQRLYATVTAQGNGHGEKSLVSQPEKDPLLDIQVCDSHCPADQSPGKKRSGSPLEQAEVPPDGTQEDSGKSSEQEEDLKPSSQQEPQNKQTMPLSQAPGNGGPSRPKKKKAVGLFR